MDRIWAYIRENKNVIFIVLGQAFLVFLVLASVYYAVMYIVNLPGFQFDPFLLILVAFLGLQFWRILDRQSRIVEKQNDLIEFLATVKKKEQLPDKSTQTKKLERK